MLFLKISFLLPAVAFCWITSLAKADQPPFEQPIGHPVGSMYDSLVPPPSGTPKESDSSFEMEAPPIGVLKEGPIGIGQNSPPVAMPPTSHPISYPTPAFEMSPTGYQLPPTGFGAPQLGIPQTGQPIAYVGYYSPVFSPVSIDDASPREVSLTQPPTGTPSFLPTKQPTQSPTKKVIRKMCRRRKLKIRINRRPLVRGNMKMTRKMMVRKRA